MTSTDDRPVPDGVTTWPIDDGRYGLVAVFKGGTGYERARTHRTRLEREGVPQKLRREMDGAWTLRLGPLPAPQVVTALGAFDSSQGVGHAVACSG